MISMTDLREKPAVEWTGRVLSLVVVLALLADALVALFAPEKMSAEMQTTGFAPSLASALGLIMLVCAIVYAIPQTAVLGAILVTGFLGAAICTHFRLGEFGSPPQLICLLLGVMTWGGLYLRDHRIRTLLPLRM
ncbi:MAG TPA: DoxX family protein [Terriglobales bacterium]|jgi:FtsH-binding integral membrane protein|nr:DoxX family protein [Terriglobales bacterium]